MAIIQIKRGLQEAVSKLVLAQGELAVALDTGNVYVGTTTGNVHVNPTGGTADQAAKLSTPRQFSASGDASAPAVQFDGTQNVALVLTLAHLHKNYTRRQCSCDGRTNYLSSPPANHPQQ